MAEDRKIWGVCLSELRHLKLTEWVPSTSKFSTPEAKRYELTTLRSVLRDYRNAVRKEFGARHPALQYLRVSLSDQYEYRNKYRATLVAQQQDLRPIDPDEILDIAETVLREADTRPVFQVAAALIPVTGRRPYEIGCRANFYPGRARSNFFAYAKGYTVIFSGQAKTRGAKNAQTGPYEIPVLLDPRLVMNAFKTMRRRYPFERIKSNVAFNRYVGKEINSAARQLFHDATQHRLSLTAKSLRDVYLAIALRWYRPESVTDNAFGARILGHAELDTQTVQAYRKMYIIGEKRDTVIEKRRSTRATIAELKRAQEATADTATRAYLEERIALLAASLKNAPRLAEVEPHAGMKTRAPRRRREPPSRKRVRRTE